MQAKIIDRPNPHELGAGKCRTLSPHQGSTSFAKGIRHCLTRGGCDILSPNGKIVASTDVADVCLVHSEIGGEHAVANLSTVCAVAKERRDEPWFFQRDNHLYLAAEAGCSSFILCGPDVSC